MLTNPSLLSYGFGLACKSLCQANLGELAEAQSSLDALSRWKRPRDEDTIRVMELQTLIQEATIAIRDKAKGVSVKAKGVRESAGINRLGIGNERVLH